MNPNSSPPAFPTLQATAADVKWRVKPGLERAFEETAQGTLQAASTYPGFTSGNVLRPEPGAADSEWQLILQFAQPAQLLAWQTSPVCRAWKARSDALTVGAAQVQRVTGLETWFTRPNQGDALAPPAWKMALVTLVSIYPLSILVPKLLEPVTRSWSPWLSGLFIAAILVGSLTWVVMPMLTSLLKGWLYPNWAPPAAPKA